MYKVYEETMATVQLKFMKNFFPAVLLLCKARREEYYAEQKLRKASPKRTKGTLS